MGLILCICMPTQPLMEAGLDSLGAVELRTALGSALGQELPATVTFDYPSVAALSRFLANQPVASTEPLVHTLLCLTISISAALPLLHQQVVLTSRCML